MSTATARWTRKLLLLLIVPLLSGCWFVVRIADDLDLSMDPAVHGRWALADGSGQLVIPSGQGCALVQVLGASEQLRWCELGRAGDYRLTAFLELREPTEVREYTLAVLRWYDADRLGLVMVDAQVAVTELELNHQIELRDPACATLPEEDRERPACTRLVVHAGQATEWSETALQRLYASGCCTDPDDESILLRVPPSVAPRSAP